MLSAHVVIRDINKLETVQYSTLKSIAVVSKWKLSLTYLIVSPWVSQFIHSFVNHMSPVFPAIITRSADKNMLLVWNTLYLAVQVYICKGCELMYSNNSNMRKFSELSCNLRYNLDLIYLNFQSLFKLVKTSLKQ